jgi:uncharacterized protein (DUF169 family)
MSTNKAYAHRLKSMGYARNIIAFKRCNVVPDHSESYGETVSFLCAIAAEMWEEGRSPVYITNKNVLCGGALYSGIGTNRVTKDIFDGAMSQTIGVGKGYATRACFRRANQQIFHIFKHHPYLLIGSLEDVEYPDVVMVVADAYRVMRLCKTYTWKTGELVYGLSGTAMCTNSFPLVYEEKTMTYNMGDEQSRCLMNLEPGEMYCLIHFDVLPLIVENLQNIQTGLAM